MGGKADRAARLDHAQGGAADPGHHRGVSAPGGHSRCEARRSRPEIGSDAEFSRVRDNFRGVRAIIDGIRGYTFSTKQRAAKSSLTLHRPRGFARAAVRPRQPDIAAIAASEGLESTEHQQKPANSRLIARTHFSIAPALASTLWFRRRGASPPIGSVAGAWATWHRYRCFSGSTSRSS